MLRIFKQKNKKRNNKGYALLEILFYIALFAILSIAVINTMITMMKAFREISVQADITQSSAILERISREIKQAENINTISVNSLKLDTTNEDGTPKTAQFTLSGANIQLFENDVLTGNLNSPNISVSILTFTQINTTDGQAVKVELAISSNRDNNNRIYNFYDTLILRGSY